MGQVSASSTVLINAEPDTVLAAVADYQAMRPKILSPQYSGYQVLEGNLSLGQLVEFNVYIYLLIWPLRMLGMIIAQGQRAAASAQRVDAVLATEPAGVSPARPTALPGLP